MVSHHVIFKSNTLQYSTFHIIEQNIKNQFSLRIYKFQNLKYLSIEILVNMETVAQMNKKLVQLNELFAQNTNEFIYKINLHQTKFTSADFNDFQKLITNIKKQVNQKISQFFNSKFQQHCQDYQNKVIFFLYSSQITKYTQNAQQLQFQLFSFRNQLQRHTIALKEEQQSKQIMLDNFSKKFFLNSIKKKYFEGFKINLQNCRKDKQVNKQADNLYRKNLMKKVFFPWRTLTYKDGYQNRVVCQTQNDIQNIHAQYTSIINVLKSKIKNTEQVIKLKKAAKGQFAYALSKNLMKTISNLSLQVMSLNQMSLQDGQYGRSNQQQKFMNQIDKIIQQKFQSVNQYKQNLLGDNTQREKQRKIRFV